MTEDEAQALREQLAQQIDGFAEFIREHGTSAHKAGELHGYSIAAKIIRDLDHFRVTCETCGIRTSAVTKETAERYRTEWCPDPEGHGAYVDDERDAAPVDGSTDHGGSDG